MSQLQQQPPINSNQTEASTSSTALKFTPVTHCCLVCGQENAKMHYGVLSCLGCKGFFRRALKKLNEYECFHNNNCIIDKNERTSCRACRLQKCLDVGMDPAAVRPDRIINVKQQPLENRFSLSPIRQRLTSIDEKTISEINDDQKSKNLSQRLPVDLRTMLMTLQNIEAKVVHGDTGRDAADIYPLRINTIREIIEEPRKLIGRRTEMRYEPYRMAKNEEFSVVVYRRLIAAVDWVELLADRIGGLSIEDRIALVKSCFGPLTLFKCSARTAVVTENEDMLCLCNFAYVPRNISKAYNDAYHLDNGLVDRLLNELVTPFRRIHLSEEEIVCVSAILVLNPMARDLSEVASNKIYSLRDRIFTTLYQIIKEYRQNCNTNTTFGNLLLYLPIITALANAMSENLRFAQTFSTLGGSPLLTSLFGCFPVGSLFTIQELPNNNRSNTELDQQKDKDECSKEHTKLNQKNVSTQTEWTKWRAAQYVRKRRYLDNPTEVQINEFSLLQPPNSYALTEMFDDCAVEAEIRNENEKNFYYEDNSDCETPPPNYFQI